MKTGTLALLLALLVCVTQAVQAKEHKPPRRRPLPPRNFPAEISKATVWQTRTVTFSKGGTKCRIVQSVYAVAGKDGTVTVTVKCLF